MISVLTNDSFSWRAEQLFDPEQDQSLDLEMAMFKFGKILLVPVTLVAGALAFLATFTGNIQNVFHTTVELTEIRVLTPVPSDVYTPHNMFQDAYAIPVVLNIKKTGLLPLFKCGLDLRFEDTPILTFITPEYALFEIASIQSEGSRWATLVGPSTWDGNAIYMLKEDMKLRMNCVAYKSDWVKISNKWHQQI